MRLSALATAVILTGCSGPPSSSAVPAGVPTPPAQDATTTAPAVVLKTDPVLHRLGEAFSVGDVRLTLLSVQDPFPPTPQVQPGPGNRLLSIKYEAVSQSPEPKKVSDLPSVEVRDAAGAIYRSEHGRLSMVGGTGTPGELPSGKRMESSVLFEVPSSAAGLRVAFRARPESGGKEAVAVID